MLISLNLTKMKLKLPIIFFSLSLLLSSCHDDNELTIKNNTTLATPLAVIPKPLRPPLPLPLFSILPSVALYLSKDAGLTGTVTVNIVDAVTGAWKGSSTISVEDVPTYTPQWVPFGFSTPPTLLMGRRHRIEIECSDKNPNQALSWYVSHTNYIPGSLGVNGSAISDSDFSFITMSTVKSGGLTVIVADQYATNASTSSYVVNISGLTYWEEFVPKR